MTIPTIDPRTGERRETGISKSSSGEVALAVANASRAFRALSGFDRTWRAGLLRSLAEGLEAHRELVVPLAEAETGLTSARLNAELTRCVVQFQLFADAVDEGSFLEATIDNATETELGPQPDVRRMLTAIGPVAVFGSSNFPFAFSVPGGDTASAIAAGNPVVLKAHGAHPLTSRSCFDALSIAASEYGAPEGLLGIVYGQQAGINLVADDGIRAVAFTGALSTGRILMETINKRIDPIPFYGELSSVNPFVVLPGAIKDSARAEKISVGLADSVLGSSGQLCTKPGAVFVPEGIEGDHLIRLLKERFEGAESAVLLNDRVESSFRISQERLLEIPGMGLEAQGLASSSSGSHARPSLLSIQATKTVGNKIEEAFGPLVVIIRYTTHADLQQALMSVPPSLTTSIHSSETDRAAVSDLISLMQPRTGRLVFDGYPTGVRVSWGQHHGGPWPSTNTLHTSVGVSSMRRFLRPIAWQSAPSFVLPDELQDSYVGIPRRIDGILYDSQP
jgi:NADP-dependent aldehyde dehydrogenase